MASGGSVWLGSSPNIQLTVNYTVTRNLSAVSITLTGTVSAVSGGSSYGYELWVRPTVNGTLQSWVKVKDASPSRWSAFTVTIGTYSATVATSSNSMPVAVEFWGNNKSSTLNFSATLPNVAPDDISSSVDFVVGNDLPIDYVTQDRSYDHAVKVIFNGTQIFYSPFRSDAIVVPLSNYADQMYEMVTDANTVPVSVTLETYRVISESPYSTQLVGSNTKTGTASFSSAECMPTFTTFSVSNSDRYLTGDDLTIIPTRSTLTLTMGSASGNKDATMVSFFATCGDKSASCPYSEGATLVLTNVNSGTVSVQAVDSRGNSTTVSKALTVLGYTAPQLGSIELKRDNAIDETVKLIYSGKWWDESFGYTPNSITYAAWRYKVSGAQSWTNGTTVITPTTSGDTFSFEGYITPVSGSWNADNSYDIIVEVSDRCNTAQIVGSINLGVPAIDARRVGATYYTGFGKVPNVSDMVNGGIDVAGDYFKNGQAIFPLTYGNGGLNPVTQYNSHDSGSLTSALNRTKTFTVSGDGLVFVGASLRSGTSTWGTTRVTIFLNNTVVAKSTDMLTSDYNGQESAANATAFLKVASGDAIKIEDVSTRYTSGNTWDAYYNLLALGCTLTVS